jgi:hypothetical protein
LLRESSLFILAHSVQGVAKNFSTLQTKIPLGPQDRNSNKGDQAKFFVFLC